MNKNNSIGHDDSLQSYFDRIKDIPLLTFEEELELSRKIQNNDEAARMRLIESNLKLVAKIARSYLTPDVSLMDLIQEGNMGLMHAVDRYDYRKRVRFSTYAAWWIRQVIARYLSDKRRIIRLPHRKEEILRKIQRSYHTLSQTHKRQPKPAEIAAEIGVSKKTVEMILGLVHDIVPVDAENSDGEYSSVIELLEDYTYSPEKALLEKSSREATLEVLNRLKDREKRILLYRYQLNGGKRQTLKKIGVKMGLSTETVRQIEIKALEKLRGHAEDLWTYAV
ncbi:MAG: RNA polymerase sigma factor RpoD/SigA [Treponema sp.]|nr:RNA polymerase sigma factor RpoD/SigA [Treponema sp.]